MRKLLYLWLLLLLPAAARAQFYNITDTGITDVGGNVLVQGTECFTPVRLQRYATPGQYPGGTFIKAPVCSPVVSGTMTPIKLVGSNATSPINLCYQRTVQNAKGLFVIGPDDGFGCVQITHDTNMNTVPSHVAGLPEYNYGAGTINITDGGSGPPGPPGAVGATGAVGNTGLTGAVGPIGPPGQPGIQGQQGQAGATGASGVQGNPGIQGIAGATGQPGATGATGIQGFAGAAGATGAVGAVGPALNLSIGAVSTVACGQPAEVSISGASTVTQIIFNFALPSCGNGSTGSTGTTTTAPTLALATIPSQVVGATVTASASSNSNGAIIYGVSGPATISGATITTTGTGTVIVAANQAASGAYSSGSTTTSFSVTAAAQSTLLADTANGLFYRLATQNGQFTSYQVTSNTSGAVASITLTDSTGGYDVVTFTNGALQTNPSSTGTNSVSGLALTDTTNGNTYTLTSVNEHLQVQ